MKDHISAVRPRTLPKPAGFSYAYEVKRGRLVFVAGQVAMGADGAIVGKGDLVVLVFHLFHDDKFGDRLDFTTIRVYLDTKLPSRSHRFTSGRKHGSIDRFKEHFTFDALVALEKVEAC